MKRKQLKSLVVGVSAVTAMSITAGTLAGAAPGSTSVGPSTTVTPYVEPAVDGVHITSLLTVGDKPADNGYRMVGIPDGLGLAKGPKGTVLLDMNHELNGSVGIVRRHGQKGAFVSQLQLDPRTGRVIAGKDLINPGVLYWDYATDAYTTTAPAGQSAAFNRFCSSSLTEPRQLYNKRTRNGTAEQIYFANEEAGDESRVFGVRPDGTTKSLPRLGLFSWENTLAAFNRSDTTLVMGDEDTSAGQVWAYVGTKTKSGDAFERAGLTNGRNNVVKLTSGITTDAGFRATYDKGDKVPFTLNDVEWDQTGALQNAEAVAEGGLTLNRIEDGAFNPRKRNEFWFVTTDGGEGTGEGKGGGLWKLTFASIDDPAAGGTLELVLDGTEAFPDGRVLDKPDNIVIDRAGNLLIQEDPGNVAAVAEILAFNIRTGERGLVAEFDRDRFDPMVTATPLTIDEESSGIIVGPSSAGDDDDDDDSASTFLFDAQVHSKTGLPLGIGAGTVEEYVENGQLLSMRIGSWDAVYDRPVDDDDDDNDG